MTCFGARCRFSYFQFEVLTDSLFLSPIIFLQFLEANLFPSAVLPASAIAFFHLSRVTSLGFPFLVLFCLGSHMMTATFIFLILSESYLCKLLLMPVRGFSPATRLPDAQIRILSYFFLYYLQEILVIKSVLTCLGSLQ